MEMTPFLASVLTTRTFILVFVHKLFRKTIFFIMKNCFLVSFFFIFKLASEYKTIKVKNYSFAAKPVKLTC